MLDGVLQGEDTTLALGFVSDVGVLLAHADHDTLVAGTTDDGGEDSAGSVVSGETGLTHTGAIVYDKSGNVVVTHLGRLGKKELARDARGSSCNTKMQSVGEIRPSVSYMKNFQGGSANCTAGRQGSTTRRRFSERRA